MFAIATFRFNAAFSGQDLLFCVYHQRFNVPAIQAMETDHFAQAMPGESIPPLRIWIRSRSPSPAPKTRPMSQAFSKQRAKPSATNIETADEMRTEEKADGANEMRTEETTDDLWTEETADAMRTEETGEDVAAELTGDNTIRTIRIPCNAGVPFSCVHCGHLNFLVLCRQPKMVWAIRCLHCRLIHKFSGFSFHSTHA